ncbi:hypothetical protein PR048_027026 [Dryococelus australis]|uniref:Uncharacterized protein n=1 Tax=Dryococelus australis TaxID=614101 RepID=A0ABQ9GMX2_9NEOP|nr:hypothetical protein PR048_027026 [Dryococelus australis]
MGVSDRRQAPPESAYGNVNKVALERNGKGKREIPEKTHRPAAFSDTIHNAKIPGAISPEIEPGSPTWESSSLTTTTPRHLADLTESADAGAASGGASAEVIQELGRDQALGQAVLLHHSSTTRPDGGAPVEPRLSVVGDLE